jgi:hypothetical protein
VSDRDHCLVIPIQHCSSFATASPAVQAEARRFLAALAVVFDRQGLGLVAFERVLQARRGEVPNHTHLQVMGVPKALAATAGPDAVSQAMAAFKTEGAFRQMAFQTLPCFTNAAPASTADAAVPTALGFDAIPAAAAAAPGAAPAPASDAAAAPSAEGVGEYFYVEVLTVGSAEESAPVVQSEAALHCIPAGTRHPLQFGREVLCRILACPDRLTWKNCLAGPQREKELTDSFRDRFAPTDFTLDL